eukprot:jgi/Mesvir1/10545/Mv21776-RA.2
MTTVCQCDLGVLRVIEEPELIDCLIRGSFLGSEEGEAVEKSLAELLCIHDRHVQFWRGGGGADYVVSLVARLCNARVLSRKRFLCQLWRAGFPLGSSPHAGDDYASTQAHGAVSPTSAVVLSAAGLLAMEEYVAAGIERHGARWPPALARELVHVFARSQQAGGALKVATQGGAVPPGDDQPTQPVPAHERLRAGDGGWPCAGGATLQGTPVLAEDASIAADVFKEAVAALVLMAHPPPCAGADAEEGGSAGAEPPQDDARAHAVQVAAQGVLRHITLWALGDADGDGRGAGDSVWEKAAPIADAPGVLTTGGGTVTLDLSAPPAAPGAAHGDTLGLRAALYVRVLCVAAGVHPSSAGRASVVAEAERFLQGRAADPQGAPDASTHAGAAHTLASLVDLPSALDIMRRLLARGTLQPSRGAALLRGYPHAGPVALDMAMGAARQLVADDSAQGMAALLALLQQLSSPAAGHGEAATSAERCVLPPYSECLKELVAADTPAAPSTAGAAATRAPGGACSSRKGLQLLLAALTLRVPEESGQGLRAAMSVLRLPACASSQALRQEVADYLNLARTRLRDLGQEGPAAAGQVGQAGQAGQASATGPHRPTGDGKAAAATRATLRELEEVVERTGTLSKDFVLTARHWRKPWWNTTIKPALLQLPEQGDAPPTSAPGGHVAALLATAHAGEDLPPEIADLASCPARFHTRIALAKVLHGKGLVSQHELSQLIQRAHAQGQEGGANRGDRKRSAACEGVDDAAGSTATGKRARGACAGDGEGSARSNGEEAPHNAHAQQARDACWGRLRELLAAVPQAVRRQSTNQSPPQGLPDSQRAVAEVAASLAAVVDLAARELARWLAHGEGAGEQGLPVALGRRCAGAADITCNVHQPSAAAEAADLLLDTFCAAHAADAAFTRHPRGSLNMCSAQDWRHVFLRHLACPFPSLHAPLLCRLRQLLCVAGPAAALDPRQAAGLVAFMVWAGAVTVVGGEDRREEQTEQDLPWGVNAGPSKPCDGRSVATERRIDPTLAVACAQVSAGEARQLSQDAASAEEDGARDSAGGVKSDRCAAQGGTTGGQSAWPGGQAWAADGPHRGGDRRGRDGAADGAHGGTSRAHTEEEGPRHDRAPNRDSGAPPSATAPLPRVVVRHVYCWRPQDGARGGAHACAHEGGGMGADDSGWCYCAGGSSSAGDSAVDHPPGSCCPAHALAPPVRWCSRRQPLGVDPPPWGAAVGLPAADASACARQHPRGEGTSLDRGGQPARTEPWVVADNNVGASGAARDASGVAGEHPRGRCGGEVGANDTGGQRGAARGGHRLGGAEGGSHCACAACPPACGGWDVQALWHDIACASLRSWGGVLWLVRLALAATRTLCAGSPQGLLLRGGHPHARAGGHPPTCGRPLSPLAPAPISHPGQGQAEASSTHASTAPAHGGGVDALVGNHCAPWVWRSVLARTGGGAAPWGGPPQPPPDGPLSAREAPGQVVALQGKGILGAATPGQVIAENPCAGERGDGPAVAEVACGRWYIGDAVLWQGQLADDHF